LRLSTVNLLKVFVDIEQGPTQEISLFKKEFDTLLRCWEAAGAPQMDQEQQATWFLEKLDKERHGSMLTVLENDRVAKMAFPVTFAKRQDKLNCSSRRLKRHHRSRGGVFTC
jgi:hypothetical protein